MKARSCYTVGLVALSSAAILFADKAAASSSSFIPGPLCRERRIGDGRCDRINDFEECDYDGGDCCECTCVSTSSFTCGGSSPYLCTDPAAPCVDGGGSDTTSSPVELCSIDVLGDGLCDPANNNEECDYDDGDCCECTCDSLSFECGINGYDCIDPSASCVDEDDSTGSDVAFIINDNTVGSFSFSECDDEQLGDGDCDMGNNNELCGYDDGDCCECTCVSTAFYTCGDSGFQCVDPSAPCKEKYVEAGTLTTISVGASAYDDGLSCRQNGCTPALTRDGVTADIQSRWSCSKDIVGGGQCTIEFTFEEPQDIADIEVAFWKVDERSRWLKVRINGRVVGTYASYPGSTFNSLGVEADDVKSVVLESVGIDEDEWISLLEVRFLVAV